MPNSQGSERRVVFQYSAPGVVGVVDGLVVSVFVVDDYPIAYPEFVEGDEVYLTEAFVAANNGRPWPSWQIGS